MTVRLLAIDQGSKACGFAYFSRDEVKPDATDVVTPPAGPWIERMKYVDEQLRVVARTRAWLPDVVAIEDVVLNVHRGPDGQMKMNPNTLVTMGETRGWLMRTVWELFPRARRIDINPQSTKAAARARTARVFAKGDIAHAVGAMTGLRGLTEDQCDAIAVGWAAFGKLAEERFAEYVDEADVAQQRTLAMDRGKGERKTMAPG